MPPRPLRSPHSGGLETPLPGGRGCLGDSTAQQTREARACLPAPRKTYLSRAGGPGSQHPGGSPVSRCPALKGSRQARKAVTTRQTQTDRRQDPAGNLLPKEKGASQQGRPREKSGVSA